MEKRNIIVTDDSLLVRLLATGILKKFGLAGPRARTYDTVVVRRLLASINAKILVDVLPESYVRRTVEQQPEKSERTDLSGEIRITNHNSATDESTSINIPHILLPGLSAGKN